MAKCCHDVDLINWWMGSQCTKVSSFGTLQHFNRSRQCVVVCVPVCIEGVPGIPLTGLPDCGAGASGRGEGGDMSAACCSIGPCLRMSDELADHPPLFLCSLAPWPLLRPLAAGLSCCTALLAPPKSRLVA